MINRSLLFLSIVLLAGCGMMSSITDVFKKDTTAEDPAKLLDFESKLEIIKEWSRGTGSGTDEQYLKLAPAISDERIYVVDSDGDIQALSTATGKKIWARDVDLDLSAGAGYAEGRVVVGSRDGSIVALDAATGKEQWRSSVSSEILSPPQIDSGIVIIRTIDGKIFGLGAETGQRLWIYDRSVPTLTLRGTSTPVIYNGVVIAGTGGGRLAALELLTGKLLWEARITTARGSSELERLVDIDSEPLIIDDVIYVTTFQGNIAAVYFDTGRILWTREISSYAGLGADERNLYITDDKSHIWAFDRYTGATLWQQEFLNARQLTAPAVIGGYLVAGDLEGYLHWISRETGEMVARNRLSSDRIIVAPQVVGDKVYAIDIDGKLAVYHYR